MIHKIVFGALLLMTSASPALAARPDPVPGEGAPAGNADARYCLRTEPTTGSRIELIQCETRQEWALLGVDVDREWAKEGVRVIG